MSKSKLFDEGKVEDVIVKLGLERQEEQLRRATTSRKDSSVDGKTMVSVTDMLWTRDLLSDVVDRWHEKSNGADSGES